jgi:transposase
VRWEAGRWFVSFTCEVQWLGAGAAGAVVAVDLGVKHLQSNIR